MNNFDPTLLCFFQNNHLQYEYHEHQPIFTVEQGEELKPVSYTHLDVYKRQGQDNQQEVLAQNQIPF